MKKEPSAPIRPRTPTRLPAFLCRSRRGQARQRPAGPTRTRLPAFLCRSRRGQARQRPAGPTRTRLPAVLWRSRTRRAVIGSPEPLTPDELRADPGPAPAFPATQLDDAVLGLDRGAPRTG